MKIKMKMQRMDWKPQNGGNTLATDLIAIALSNRRLWFVSRGRSESIDCSELIVKWADAFRLDKKIECTRLTVRFRKESLRLVKIKTNR